ncbi:MAG TPA: hypothetical protein VFY35_03400 [Burkholderiaceae bacterium]|nr:hypothetical protein [Burkholderiaceae bacterium]
MNTRIRPTSSSQAAADVRRHEALLHTQKSGGQGGSVHRGQFGGYVFRLGRAPAPPAARRPPPLRRRPPRPPGAQSLELEHDASHDALSNMGPSAESSAWQDQALSASLDMEGSHTHDDTNDPMRDGEAQAPYRAMQWKLGQHDRPAGQDATGFADAQPLAGLQAQALLPGEVASAPVHHDALALALVNQMLAQRPAAPSAPGVPTQATRLQLAAVRAYLLAVHEHQLAPGPLSTLAHVKQLLLDRAPGGGQGPVRTLPDEAQQNLNLLLPLKLLHADRPRTPEQIQQACDRIELSCQLTLASVPPATP